MSFFKFPIAFLFLSLTLGCGSTIGTPSLKTKPQPQVWNQSPSIPEFPSSGLSYIVKGDVYKNRLFLIKELSNEQWPTTQTIEGIATYVITVYLEEGYIPKSLPKKDYDDAPPLENESQHSAYIVADLLKNFYNIPSLIFWSPKKNNGRMQRVAFMMRLREAPKPKSSCTEIFVSWKIESRGIREETWRSTDEDKATQPMLTRVITRCLGALKNCN